MYKTFSKIDFLSVALQGGTDLEPKADKPHIAQQGETSLLPYGTQGSSQILEESPQPMSVDVTVMIQIPFGSQSTKYQSNFSKYMKVRVIQSTSPTISDQIANNSFSWLKHGGLLQTSSPVNISLKTQQFKEFDGKTPEESQEYSSSIEIKHDKQYNKIYCFPFKFNFKIPELNGGVKVNHLTYFAHTYIDLEELEKDKQFEDSGMIKQDYFQKLSMGPVSRQVIIQNGDTKNSNQVFYTTPVDSFGDPISFPNLRDEKGNIIGKDYSGSSIWTGAVHYHGVENPGPNGYIGYMAGTAGADMGPFLTAASVSNNIVQDFRKFKDIQKLNFDYSMFSNSWYNASTLQSLQSNYSGAELTKAYDNPYISEDIDQYMAKAMSNSANKSLFGEMYTGMDGSGNTRFAFSFDAKEAIKQNTVFPALALHIFENSSQDEVDQILKTKIIKDFKIYRHRVHKDNPAHPTVDNYEDIENQNLKLVVNSSEQKDGFLAPKTQTDQQTLENVGAIRQVDIDLPLLQEYSQNSVKFYTGTDLNTPTAGSYILSAEITMSDPIITWMLGKINNLEECLYGSGDSYSYRNYLSDCKSNPRYFNLHTNRFSDSGLGFLMSKYGSSFSYDKIYQFFSILDKFALLKNDKEKTELFSFLTTISSPEYGSPSGVEVAFNIMEDIYSRILNIYSSSSKYKKPIDSQHVESQYSAGSNPDRSYTIRHKFDTKIDGKTNHLTGYDFLSLENTIDEDSQIALGLKNLSAADYNQRVSLEVSKLFPQAPVGSENPQNSEENIEIHGGGKVLNPTDFIDFTKYGYLSPSVINFAQASSKKLLNNGDVSLDIDSFNNSLMNIIKQNIANDQNFDFPLGTVVTATENNNPDSIIKHNSNNESKYDALSLLNLEQASVTTKGGKDIISSSNDPINLFFSTIQEKYFNFLSDLTWTWEYYVQPAKPHIYDEYKKWHMSADIQSPYESDNSPLKRAPNHVKALMLHLDPKKKLQNYSFDLLKEYLESEKPEAYSYNISQEKVAPNDPSDFFAANLNTGKTKIIPKNKVLYQTPEFMSFFMLNYKKIVKIEYLVGYNNENINNPIWSELTNEAWKVLSNRSGNIVCRMIPYEKELYGVRNYSFLNLPIYNRHFIINFGLKGDEDPTIQRALFEGTRIIVGGEQKTILPTRNIPPASRLVSVLPAYNPQRAEDIGERLLDQTLTSIDQDQMATPVTVEPTQQDQGDSGTGGSSVTVSALSGPSSAY